MKCQILFSGKNKKNISKCRLLKILPRVLSVKSHMINRILHSWSFHMKFMKLAEGHSCKILTVREVQDEPAHRSLHTSASTVC